MPTPTAVIAVGGNALSPAGERSTIHDQFRHTRQSLVPVVDLALDGWNVCLVHGNGPQVGDALVRNEVARSEVSPLPLGVLVAATAGWIGYMIQQSLKNALDRFGVKRDVVTIVTQVVVDPDDPATQEPIKPIGRAMDDESARSLQAEGVPMQEVKGGWRRLIASPIPIRIVEHAQIRSLLDSGTIVIAAGGGGCPVYVHPRRGLEGLDAVIDKDRAAQVLGGDVDASAFMILTDVDGVYRNFGKPDQELISEMSVAEARALLDSEHLAKGSMAPKVEAAVAFVEAGGATAHIGRLDAGIDVVEGRAGTTIRP